MVTSTQFSFDRRERAETWNASLGNKCYSGWERKRYNHVFLYFEHDLTRPYQARPADSKDHLDTHTEEEDTGLPAIHGTTPSGPGSIGRNCTGFHPQIGHLFSHILFLSLEHTWFQVFWRLRSWTCRPLQVHEHF